MKETVENILREKTDGTQLFLVDVLLRGNKIEIFADGDAGISLQDCARLNRSLHEGLEARGIDTGKYIVEISSPGLDRPLADARSYKKNVGRNLKLRNRQNKIFNGRLALASKTGLVLAQGKKTEYLSYTDILEAKAVI